MYTDMPSKSCTSSYQTPPLQLPVGKNPYLIIQNSQYITSAYGIDTAFAFACIFQCRYQARVLVFTTNITHSVCFDRLAFLMILTNGIDTATSLATVHGILALHRVTTYPLGRSRYQARLVYMYEQ